MAHNVEAFKYCPLDLAKDEIRLVRLQSRQLSDEIECELVQVNLEHDPQYEALSYEWGDQPKSAFWITVDGNLHQIRENLWFALRDLRLRDQKRLLWIDALCINQNDTKERNHQVAQMGEIYRNAKRVIVWIGPERLDKTAQEDALIAISFLEDTKRRPLKDFIPSPESERQSLLLERKGYDRAWKALLSLCQRSYWSRLWIIQEVVLAAKLIVHCGELKFNWGVLTRLFAELNNHARDGKFDVGGSLRSSIPARLDWQRLVRKKEEQGSPILDLLFNNADAMCVDVRDKFWGVHSLAKPCCQRAIPIDYSKTLVDLCTAVLQHDFLYHRPKGFAYARSAQRLRAILLDHLKPGERVIQAEKMWSMESSVLISPTDSAHLALIELSGKLKGPITWFGSRSLYKQTYEPWMAKSMGGGPFDATRIPALLDDPEWSFPSPNMAVRNFVVDFRGPGTTKSRCRSVNSFKSYATIASRDHQPPPVEVTDASPPGPSSKVEKKAEKKVDKILQGAVQTIRRVRRPSQFSLLNDFDGNRLLGLNDGLIAHAPKDAQIGDLVCQFEKCNFLVIIREDGHILSIDGNEHGPVFKIVGSAGLIRKPPSAEPSVEDIKKVTLTLDIFTLQKLCWTFPYKERSANT